jgi:hypothetical protein
MLKMKPYEEVVDPPNIRSCVDPVITICSCAREGVDEGIAGEMERREGGRVTR